MVEPVAGAVATRVVVPELVAARHFRMRYPPAVLELECAATVKFGFPTTSTQEIVETFCACTAPVPVPLPVTVAINDTPTAGVTFVGRPTACQLAVVEVPTEVIVYGTPIVRTLDPEMLIGVPEFGP